MFCPNCGEQISEHAEICPKCGVRVKNNTSSGEDKPNWVINILSFCCIPLLGIIMYFVWKNDKPKAAKSALTFGLISIGLAVVSWLISMAIGISSSSY